MRALLFLAALPACVDYSLTGKGKDASVDFDDDSGSPPDSGDTDTSACFDWDFPARDVGITDLCDFGGTGSFEPIIEWNLGEGKYSRATVAVGDVDLDGMPDIVANITGLFGDGSLVVARGDGSGTLFEVSTANIGYAAHPAIGDIDGDGDIEIVIVREYTNSMLAVGDYTLVAYDAEARVEWESDHFIGDDFDYASAIHLSDMDHDGSVEIIAGRVILNSDGTTRGVGEHGRGSFGSVPFGDLTMDEASNSAVADLDLDGVEEVITGNAMYSPDGETLWYDASEWDGMVGVANLDDDEFGEFVAVSNNSVRGVDTDGTELWGPVEISTANIMSPPAIDDLDADGYPEIVVAGGNQLLVLNHDGSVAWKTRATDMSGASGASIFDFEGDGMPEVVYIDEVEMAAYDGVTGALKFYSTDHASDTMYDYPVIADVDADGHAEIVVAHAGWDAAISIYGDKTDSWAPARKIWNQHAYCVTNINDDLSIPTDATPNFKATNSWHSALDRAAGESLALDVEGELLDVCQEDCDEGWLRVAGRLLNRSAEDLPAGVAVALYAVVGGVPELADVQYTTQVTPSATTGETLSFSMDAEVARSASRLTLVADDDGTGTGTISECSDDNNADLWDGSFCL